MSVLEIMATNILKTTEIYGSLSVKDRYATYSNIGVGSGEVVVPAYFQNQGTTDLNQVSVLGNIVCGGKTEGIYLRAIQGVNGAITQGFKNLALRYGSYMSWNFSINDGECDFITSKSAGTGGFRFYNVSTDTSNSSVLLASINPNGNVKSNNVTSTNKTDIEALQTNTTGQTYTTGKSKFTGNVSVQSNTLNLYKSPYSMGIQIIDATFDFYIFGLANGHHLRLNSEKGTNTGDVLINDGSPNSRVGILTTTPMEALDVAGNVKCTYLKTSSDYRLKQNVQPLNGDYDITNLNPVSYNMGGCKSTGFIAHELQEVFPHLVTGKKDGYEMQSVDYIGMIGILTYNLQNLKKEVDELKSKLNI